MSFEQYSVYNKVWTITSWFSPVRESNEEKTTRVHASAGRELVRFPHWPILRNGKVGDNNRRSTISCEQ